MKTKVLEIRDEGTFILALAVDMNPYIVDNNTLIFAMERWALRHCGYPCDGRPNILLTRLSGDGQATNDPYGWTGNQRTFPTAHKWIIEHWNELKDGDVVDVSFILGERETPKISERISGR
jgi:hypothetical protein